MRAWLPGHSAPRGLLSPQKGQAGPATHLPGRGGAKQLRPGGPNLGKPGCPASRPAPPPVSGLKWEEGAAAGGTASMRLQREWPGGKMPAPDPRGCRGKAGLGPQLHLTLCNPMASSPSGSSVRGILQAGTLERVATPSSMWVLSLSQEDPLEEEMATHSSIFAWKIPWTEEPGGLQFMRSQKSQA